MKTSEQLDKILPALAKVKAGLTGVKKGTKNSFFKSSYADLNAHLDGVETLLEENGLVLLQPVTIRTDDPTKNMVTSRIYEVGSGQWVESDMNLIGETDMQKAGSAITYARRYTLGSLLCMKAVDDDGESAVGRGNTKSAAKPATKSKPSFNKNKAKASAFPSAPIVESNGDDI